MQWLQLTNLRGDPVWVNFDHILSFHRQDPNTTHLQKALPGGEGAGSRVIHVKEEPAQIFNQLRTLTKG
jgi:hypothetical protein